MDNTLKGFCCLNKAEKDMKHHMANELTQKSDSCEADEHQIDESKSRLAKKALQLIAVDRTKLDIFITDAQSGVVYKPTLTSIVTN